MMFSLPPIRRSARFVAATITAFALGTPVVANIVSGVAHADSTIHVAVSGHDGASGSASSPVKTIARAVQMAPNGATVRIAPGRYHESVQVYSKQLHLVGTDDGVVLDGASPVSGWTASGDRWHAPWTTDFERSGAPFTRPELPEAGWPEQFFLDGEPLTEVGSLGSLGPGRFYYDKSSSRVWIGDNPSGRLVEGSDLSWGLYLNRAHGSSVTGLTVQRYGTETRHMAAFRAYSNDLVVRDVNVVHNARMGLSMIGHRIETHGLTASDNGHLGIHGHQSTDLSIETSIVVRNNAAGFDPFHSAGGVKVTESDGLLVADSYFAANDGPGVWTDLSVTDVVIRSSRMENNGRSGIELELSSDIVVVDNVVLRNGETGVWVLESSDVDVWNNAAYDNVRDIWVEDGPRSDVNRVAIFNNLLGGDVRADGEDAVLNVDDWTQHRSADQMAVTAGSNRYWMVPGSITTALSRWARWPSPLAISTSMAAHQSATGQGQGSDLVSSSSDPFSSSATDYRQPASAPLALPLPVHVAAAAEASTAARRAGPISNPFGVSAAPTTTTTTTTVPPTTTTTTTVPPTTAPPTTTTTTVPPTTTTTTTTTTTVPPTTAPPTTAPPTTAPPTTAPPTTVPPTTTSTTTTTTTTVPPTTAPPTTVPPPTTSTTTAPPTTAPPTTASPNTQSGGISPIPVDAARVADRTAHTPVAEERVSFVTRLIRDLRTKIKQERRLPGNGWSVFVESVTRLLDHDAG